MNKIIGIIVALLVLGGGVYFLMQNSKPMPEVYSEKPTAEGEVELEEEPVVPEEVQATAEVGVVTAAVAQNVTTEKAGMFLAYAPSEVTNPMSEDVVLAFFADWCPSCRAVKSDIQANLGSIPANLTILDVDYDEYTDLKKKYGINQQHTFVQVDKTGAVIKTWKGGNTLESIVAQVN